MVIVSCAYSIFLQTMLVWAKLGHLLKQNMAFYYNKTWPFTQAKHGLLLKQNMAFYYDKTWPFTQAKHGHGILL